jgi:hypothetical protein
VSDSLLRVTAGWVSGPERRSLPPDFNWTAGATPAGGDAMPLRLFDPTSPPNRRAAMLAPRPARLAGLRIGLVENTKFNAEVLLRKLADRLGERHGMPLAHTDRKRSPSHEVTEQAVATLRRQADFVVSGIGD